MKYSALFIWLIGFGCREYYEPPLLKNLPRLLVVDGFLNSSPDSIHIKLTYTRNLRDTAPAVPALNATLMVEGDQNDSLSWEQDTTDVRFYINTHDPQNNTVYYHWHYEETWQYTT